MALGDLAFESLANPSAASGETIPLLVLAGLLLALAFRRAFESVGMTFVDAGLLALAPLAAAWEHTVAGGASTVIAVNAAGAIIPIAIATLFLARIAWRGGTPPVARFLVGVAIVTAAAYLTSRAIPSEGVLLYYRIPALVAVVVALAFSWGVWHETGLFAYAIGAVGVTLGADFFRLHELLVVDDAPHRIVIGGAGVLDGIFIVALLALSLAALAASLADTWGHKLAKKWIGQADAS